MLKKTLKRFAVFSSVLALCFSMGPKEIQASHAMAIDFYYECLGGNNYQFTMAFYRDCAGISQPDSILIAGSSSCGSTSFYLVPTGSCNEVSNYCDGNLNSTCNGGTQPGSMECIYSGNVTLSNCADWIFSTTQCCRNALITNLVNPDNEDMYVEVTMDNSSGICNNSPQFNMAPVPFICDGEPFCYDHGAVDPDGDSLVYTLMNPMTGGGSAIAYVSGYSVSYPISTQSGSLTLDSVSGQMCFTPNGVQVCIVSILVEEYRAGVLIGTTMRDMQVIVLDCSGFPPVLQASAPCGTDYIILESIDTMDCSSIASDGSDFIISGPGGPFTVTGASGVDCGISASQIQIDVSPPLSAGQAYTLSIVTGTDANSLINICGDTLSDSTEVLLNASPFPAEIYGASTVCSGTAQTLTASGGSSWVWSTGDTTQIIEVTPLADTTYWVIITNDTCTGTDSISVTADPTPTAGFIMGTLNPCVGYTINFTNTSITGCFIPFLYYEWDFGDSLSPFPNNDENPTYTYTIPGTYTVSLTTLDMFCGCSNVYTSTITVGSGVAYLIPNYGDTVICQGDSALVFGAYRNIAGTYYDTLPTVAGCDSILSTTLTVLSSVFTNLGTITVCPGDSAMIFGSNQNSAGVYYDTLQTVNSCDSILSRTLLVFSSTPINIGDSTICQGDSILLFGSYENSAGTYYDSLLSVGSCDSILVSTLLVLPTSYITMAGDTICQGGSALLFGTYQNSAGIYYDSLQTVGGCDSVLSKTLVVLPSPFISMGDITICEGDSVLIFGSYQNSTGTYYDSLQTVDGCDSVLSTGLIVFSSAPINIGNIAICFGDSALIFGSYQDTNGVYIDSLLSVNGCDSIVAIAMTIGFESSDSVDVSICTGDSIFVEGTYQTTTGTYVDSFSSVHGCDSIIISTLSVFQNTFMNMGGDTICLGDSILLFGAYQNSAGTYYDSLQTVDGCDSIISMNLVIDTVTGTDVITACLDYTWIDGIMYFSSNNTATHTVTSSSGCDSIITLDLTIGGESSTSFNVSLCAGDSIFLEGVYQTSPGYYVDIYSTMYGCDSAIITYLTVDSVDLGVTIAIDGPMIADQDSASYVWLNCTNDSIIPGATNQDYDTPIDGEYAVIVTKDGCTDTSACILFIVDGISEYNVNNKVTLYPNPAKESLTFEFESKEDRQITVYNSVGQLIVSIQSKDKQSKIDMSDAAPGIYHFEVHSLTTMEIIGRGKFVRE